MPFCSNCGTKLEDSAKFCPSCGTPAGGGTPTAPSAQATEKVGNIHKCPSCGVAVALHDERAEQYKKNVAVLQNYERLLAG